MSLERFVVRISGIACCLASIYFLIFDVETQAAVILMFAAFVALFWYIWTE